MRVLGLSAFYHDSAAALVDDGRVIAAAQEERFTRKKGDASFPAHAAAYCLRAAGITASELECVGFYDKPLLKFERILQTYLGVAPRGFESFFLAAPMWLKDKLYMDRQLREALAYSGDVLYAEHHESHAASAFFPSPFENAAWLTIDGAGEWATAAYGVGHGNEMELLNELHWPDSLGLLYSAFTYYTGFKVNSGEYKVMGLAPYGRPVYLDKLLGPILTLQEDGAFGLNERFFDFCSRERHYAAALVAHLGIPPRRPDEPVREEHCDVAASVQQALELAIAGILSPLMREYGTADFCFAGGVALNCTANARMIRDLGIRSHIHPAAGDAGGALGAALQSVMLSREGEPTRRYRLDAYLGVEYAKPVIKTTLSVNDIPYRECANVAEELADMLVAGKVVAILHGRDEWGPRALGARSILADPRRAEMKDHLNAKIKFREEFRPFAPVVKKEAYGDWFETLGMAESPFMLYTHKALRADQTAAVTHVDGTSRVQTVTAEQNPYVYRILDAFERRTGVPVLINTSFNLRGEPIVSSPSDALKTFFASGIDCLALEDVLVEKESSRDGGARD